MTSPDGTFDEIDLDEYRRDYKDDKRIQYLVEEISNFGNKIWLNLDEARALNALLRVHHGLFREQEEYTQILRLINGLGTFVDKHDQR